MRNPLSRVLGSDRPGVPDAAAEAAPIIVIIAEQVQTTRSVP
jgi:hypothetical protein